MSTPPRNHADDLRAVSKLVISATTAVTDVVQDMHVTIGSGPRVLGKPLGAPVRALTALVYGPIRGITRLVGAGIDVALAQLEPWLGESTPGPQREALRSALNGVLGDTLEASGNPLAIRMTLRRDGQDLPLEPHELRALLPDATSKLLVLVHGSSMNDRQWCRHGHDHGRALETEHGFTAVYVQYNSGLHVSDNGRALAELLHDLVAAWPIPPTELVLLGHSMGGLVARSACHVAALSGLDWLGLLRTMVFLGTPHHGSPLEVGGSFLHALLGVTAYSAPLATLARIRSAGVTDLRYGYVLDEHWHGRDRFAHHADARRELALPVGVACYAIAASTGVVASDRLPGDGLVPVQSALGRHERAELTLAIPPEHQWIALGTDHLGLLDRPEVYAQLSKWLAPAR